MFVDGFLDFSEAERRILAVLAGVCRRMEITILMDGKSPMLRDIHQMPDEFGLFYRLEETYRRLLFALNEAGAKMEPPLVLDDPKRLKSEALIAVERYAFGAGRKKSEGGIFIPAAEQSASLS